MPHSNGQMMVAWSPAATPIFRCPSEKRASLAAMEMSARITHARPAPTAQPRAAVTMGFEQLIMP
ncbi:Uncharacterised protein [Achromobacter xylosoxidans]|nr:Uncharacterised protein [Achromobacter xylosoxidans]